MSDTMSGEGDGGAVLAQGGLNLLREIQAHLKRRGIASDVVRPPGFTGKG
jgi:hypothetical protein